MLDPCLIFDPVIRERLIEKQRIETMKPLAADSLQDVLWGARVRLEGNGVRETFQATQLIGGRKYFVSLQFGFEYTRPQLIEKYMRAGCSFTVEAMPEAGWSHP